jgi:DNA mismatch repair protein MutS
VAKLAGLPPGVVFRAATLLTSFEEQGTRPAATATGKSRSGSRAQLELFHPPSTTPQQKRVLDRIGSADIDRLSPLEALTLLAELKTELECGSKD